MKGKIKFNFNANKVYSFQALVIAEGKLIATGYSSKSYDDAKVRVMEKIERLAAVDLPAPQEIEIPDKLRAVENGKQGFARPVVSWRPKHEHANSR